MEKYRLAKDFGEITTFEENGGLDKYVLRDYAGMIIFSFHKEYLQNLLDRGVIELVESTPEEILKKFVEDNELKVGEKLITDTKVILTITRIDDYAIHAIDKNDIKTLTFGGYLKFVKKYVPISRPFANIDEAKMALGRVVFDKRKECYMIITGVSFNYITTDDNFYEYREAYEQLEFIDLAIGERSVFGITE